MKNGPKVENWWPIKALKCRFVHGEHVPMPDQLSLRRQSTALWRRHSLLGRHRRTSLLYVHVYVFHTTIRSLHGCPLDVFNLFNYGQLLVHSRALLSSQIACVICFIKLLVTNIRLIDWLICWFLFFCFILCFCTFVTIISPFELMRCIILLLSLNFMYCSSYSGVCPPLIKGVFTSVAHLVSSRLTSCEPDLTGRFSRVL